MWKRQGGVELQVGGSKGLIPSNNKTVWPNSEYGKWSQIELANSVFKLSANRDRRIVTFADKTFYNWSLEIDMLGGGIQVSGDVFNYRAPEEGYESKLILSHKAGDADWLSLI